MVFIESKQIFAKEEPNPIKKRVKIAPHYIVIPNSAYGENNESFSRKISDPEGYLDPRKQSLVPAEIDYLFIKNNPTPVWKEEHVLWILENLAGLGAYECAYTTGPDKVEHFHPERTNALDRRINGRYDKKESFEWRTKTFKPVPSIVLRTGEDVMSGKKRHLTEEQRRAKAEGFISEPLDEEEIKKPSKAAKGSKK